MWCELSGGPTDQVWNKWRIENVNRGKEIDVLSYKPLWLHKVQSFSAFIYEYWQSKGQVEITVVFPRRVGWRNGLWGNMKRNL